MIATSSGLNTSGSPYPRPIVRSTIASVTIAIGTIRARSPFRSSVHTFQHRAWIRIPAKTADLFAEERAFARAEEPRPREHDRIHRDRKRPSGQQTDERSEVRHEPETRSGGRDPCDADPEEARPFVVNRIHTPREGECDDGLHRKRDQERDGSAHRAK